jgi:hypothetical protein
MSNEKVTKGGLSFTSVLFFIFLVLKLTGFIDWSWIWVCSPLWIPLATFLTMLGGIFLFALIVAIFDR